VADLIPELLGGVTYDAGWCECPCAGCGEPLLIQEGDDIYAFFDAGGQIEGVLCVPCARRNEAARQATRQALRRRHERRLRLVRRVAGGALVCFAALAAAEASFGFYGPALLPAAGVGVLAWALWATRLRRREGT
jgi:hypothetical protein